MIYWFMTFCHELAHNFIQNHSSQHEVSEVFFLFLLFFFNNLINTNNPKTIF